MTTLEMLTSREQLMEDIEAIVDTFCRDHSEIHNIARDPQDDLTRILCDAVCANFPVK